MSRKISPTDTIEQAEVVLEAWKNIDPALEIGSMPIATLESQLTEARALYMQINSLETQLVGMRNQRDALNLSIWDKIKRVRTGVKSIFGDDSSEYEMVGGTRMSDRKHPTRQEEPAA
jgi:hypothetical protein